MAIITGRTRCSAESPAEASAAMIASGPWATEVSASRERAGNPVRVLISSRETSLARSGRPNTPKHGADEQSRDPVRRWSGLVVGRLQVLRYVASVACWASSGTAFLAILLVGRAARASARSPLNNSLNPIR